MGLIRGTLFTVVSIMLFVSLLSMNTFWTISRSLDYDVLQDELVPLTTSTIVNQTDLGEQIDIILPAMELYCLDVNKTEFAYTFSNITYQVPCEAINNGSESVISYIIESLVEENYYKEYDCDLWDCDASTPSYLISQKAQEYWSEWFYMTLLISILLIVASIIIMENRSGYPLILGGLLIISSLLFAKIEWFFSFLGDFEWISFLGLFFSEAYTVFLIEFIIGIVLILVGISLKFLGLGQWLNNLLSAKKKG